MKKHVFLILNYKAHDYTISCIKTIQKLHGEKEIVVVDNDLNSDSFKLLTDKYMDVKNVFVIQTKENLGFARGNNFGRKFIDKTFKTVDFIHCINSDILVEDVDTLLKTESFYKETNFYLMGPNVITHDKETSPIGLMKDQSDFKKINKRLKLLTRIYYVIAIFFQRIMGTKLEDLFNARTSVNVQKALEKDQDIVPILSGCYLVFSKDFLNKYDFLFSDVTFLYNEETILTYLLLKDNIRAIYFSKIYNVIHDHAGSSKSNNRQKARYVLDNLKNMENL